MTIKSSVHSKDRSLFDSLECRLGNQFITAIEPLTDAESSIMDAAVQECIKAQDSVKRICHQILVAHCLHITGTSKVYGYYVVGGEDGNTVEKLTSTETDILRGARMLASQTYAYVDETQKSIGVRHGFPDGCHIEITGKFIVAGGL